MIFSGPVVGAWLWKHKSMIGAGLLVIACAGFISSWMTRGSKIDRMEIDKKTAKAVSDFALSECQKACDEVLDEVKENSRKEIKRGKLREARLLEGLNAANALADEEHRRAARIEGEVAARIDAAETCEEKQRVFLRAMQERVEQ